MGSLAADMKLSTPLSLLLSLVLWAGVSPRPGAESNHLTGENTCSSEQPCGWVWKIAGRSRISKNNLCSCPADAKCRYSHYSVGSSGAVFTCQESSENGIFPLIGHRRGRKIRSVFLNQ